MNIVRLCQYKSSDYFLHNRPGGLFLPWTWGFRIYHLRSEINTTRVFPIAAEPVKAQDIYGNGFHEMDEALAAGQLSVVESCPVEYWVCQCCICLLSEPPHSPILPWPSWPVYQAGPLYQEDNWGPTPNPATPLQSAPAPAMASKRRLEN